MADAATIRAWAKAEELEVNARGAIPEHIIAAYDDAHPLPPGDDGGVTEADFPPPLDPGPDEPSEPARPRVTRARAERKPRAVKPPRKDWKAMFGGGTGKPKSRGPRTDLSEFAEDTWRDLALLAEGIMPPVSKVLTLQAPYAGVTFDAAVRGLPLVDSVLQPVARYSVSIRALNGLVGPAFFTAAICATGEWVTTDEGLPVITPDGRPVPTARTAMMLSGLKYSLLQMSRTADLEKVRERAEADAERMHMVDSLVDFIFGFPAAQSPAPAPDGNGSPPPPPGSPAPPSGQPGQVLVPTFIYPPKPEMDDAGMPAQV